MAQPKTAPRERVVAAFLRAWMADPEKREAALAAAFATVDACYLAMGWQREVRTYRPRAPRSPARVRGAAPEPPTLSATG